MALVEIFHVVAADRVVATGETIKEGQIVSLNSDGEVVIQSVTNPICYGIAGDTKSTSASAMPGIVQGWQNRVSDGFDETKASGMMTVYHSGGEFATDQFSANVANAAVMTPVYAVDGVLETIDAYTGGLVGYVIKACGTYPSGVPGVDINGDAALAGNSGAVDTNTYVEIKLVL